jgi:hypothetical protein
VAAPANSSSFDSPSSAGQAVRPRGSALFAAGASALAGLVASTVLGAAVAGLLGASRPVPAPATAPTAPTAPRDENGGDSRHGSTADADQRRAEGSAEAVTQLAASWLVTGLSADARAAVKADLAAAVPAVVPILRSLSGAVSMDSATRYCRAGAPNCSYAEQGAGGRWGIHLSSQTTSASYPSNRFVVYHEIGHAVWGLLLTDKDRRDFAGAVRASLHGRPCMDGRGGPCAVLEEVFADEFARYAGGFRVSMSFYETPSLLDRATFGSLAAHWTHRPAWPTPHGSAGSPPVPLPTAAQRPTPVRGRRRR